MKPKFQRLAYGVMVAIFALVPSFQVAAEPEFYDFLSSNNIVFYDPNDKSGCVTVSGGSGIRGNNNIEKMWNYFLDKGLSGEQAAGILGNIQMESGFSAFRQETSQQWPAGGYGIVQWTGGRRRNLEAKMKTDLADIIQYYSPTYGGATSADKGFVPNGVDIAINDRFLNMQLDYLYQESTTRKVSGKNMRATGQSEWDAIKAAKSLREASDIWLFSFERPADQSESHAQKRAALGQAIFSNLSRSTRSQSPTNQDTSSSGTSTIATTKKGVIFLDPAHGGEISSYTDERTGLVLTDPKRSPETEQMFIVAQRIKAGLEKNGFTVILSRSSNDQKIDDRQRVNAAISAKAILGVSLHASTATTNEAWAQRVGAYREYNGKRTVFNNEKTAKKSQEINAIIAKKRAAAEGRLVGTDPAGSSQSRFFSGSDTPSKGNIPTISLFAESIPWSYNEFALGGSQELSEAQLNNYAKGIIEGVTEANPAGVSATTGGCEDGEFAGGDLTATTLAFAWPDYKGDGFTKAKPEYAAAIKKAKNAGLFVGGGMDYCRQNQGVSVESDGVDCGGFVTRLMMDSGWEPAYNHNGKGGGTNDQEAWLKAHWQSLGNNIDVATLKPGDVAISPGHTFVYVGSIDGFGSNIASASLCSRSPMAGKEALSNGETRWYRREG